MTTPLPEPGPDLLACGRDPLTVVDHARAGRLDEHERHCTHCHAAIAGAGLTGRAAAELTAAAAGSTVPATLLPNIMRIVWAELRHSATIALPTPDGTAFATQHALNVAVRRSLEEGIDDLIVHSCQVTLPDPAADNSPPPLTVQLSAAAAYHADLPALAERARTATLATLRTQFGLTADLVDIDFIDIFRPESPTP